ncbi:O-antigen ligase family protein [Nocardioides sp. 503]|uniref:O-antigen ligase family protein n=1 Tax=Nocardioides sp. 503 TaxID=2508326 RepID=UPI00106F3FD8|nr:O-antigen ligase family protein [Nocardioides sp. 503]
MTTAPATRTSSRGLVLGALVAAPVLGLLAGFAPMAALVGVMALVVVVALLLRIEWAALAVVGTAVFEDYLVPVDPRVMKGLALLLVGAWLLRRCLGRLHDGGRNPVLVCALAFVAVLLAATALHTNGQASIDVLLRYAGFLAVLAVLTDVMRAGLPPARVARVYVLSCAVASACGIAEYIMGEDRRVGGPIGDPNDLAFFLLAGLPLAFALRGSARRPWVYDLAAGVILLAVLGTLSRGALLGLAVVAVAALLMGLVRWKVALGFGALSVVALLVVLTAFPQLIETSLSQKEHVAGQNVSERLDLWQSAGRMTLENPVLGLGPGSFSQQHRDFADSLPLNINHTLDVAHNTYLEVSSETGLLGLVVFLAILVTAYLGAWSHWRRTRDPLGGAVCVALLGTAVAAAFVTEQYFLPLWLLAALGAALGATGATGVPAAPEQE